MRTLYHFVRSPFSRRVRLALAHKGLEAELIEARERPELFAAVKERSPFATVPLLVEDDGVMLADSLSILHWLDRAYPDRPKLWPDEPGDALLCFETSALVNDALDTIVAAGNRFFRLRDHAAWNDVLTTEVARAQRALENVARRVADLGRPTIARAGWSAADMTLFTATAWLAHMPEHTDRPVPAQILTLGWRVPDELLRWNESHASRPDIRALGPA